MVRSQLARQSSALAVGAALLMALGVGCRMRPDEVAGSSGTSGAGGTGGSAGGSGGSRMPLEELASGENAPYRLAIDDRYVFWIAGNELRRAPVSGGNVATLATGQGLSRVVAAAGYVYFTDGLAGRVSRVSREGGSVEVLGGGVYSDGIAVGGDWVYWANAGMIAGNGADGTLARVSRDGSGSVLLAEGLQRPSGVAVDDESVYFTSTSVSCGVSSDGNNGCVGGGVSRLPVGGGLPEVVDSEGAPMDVVAGQAGAYWVDSIRVKFAPRGGGAVQTLATLSGEEAGPIAVDADAVYMSSGIQGRVVKVPFDGTEPFPVVVDLGGPGGIAVDGDWVYVAATDEGRILRVAKDGSAADPGDPITGPCPTPVGTPEAIAATPREDENLELLAITLDVGEVTASQETYDRVTADVASIRDLEPALADIDYFPRDDGRTLVLSPTDLAAKSMKAGEYTAWDCLNDFYGVASVLIMDSFGTTYVDLELEGNYALDVLARVYGELPGIERVDPNLYFGDGPTLCAARDGEIYEYVIDRAGGDCPAGCTTHDAHHFQSTAPGVIEALDVWTSGSATPPPDWFMTLCR